MEKSNTEMKDDTEYISVGFHPVKNVVEYFIDGIRRECSIAEARDIGKLFLHQADKLEKFPKSEPIIEPEKVESQAERNIRKAKGAFWNALSSLERRTGNADKTIKDPIELIRRTSEIIFSQPPPFFTPEHTPEIHSLRDVIGELSGCSMRIASGSDVKKEAIYLDNIRKMIDTMISCNIHTNINALAGYIGGRIITP